jgi:hypothetical protein
MKLKFGKSDQRGVRIECVECGEGSRWLGECINCDNDTQEAGKHVFCVPCYVTEHNGFDSNLDALVQIA